MNILYTIPEGIDMGGIVTSTEQLIQGFRDLGHTASFALLRPTKTQANVRKNTSGYLRGEGTGMLMHPVKGWIGPYYSFGYAPDRQKYIKHANSYDLVIWGNVYGLRNKVTEGTRDWLEVLSKVRVPQIAMIRDDHLTKRYPWAAQLEKYIVGWACVQQTSFDNCAGLTRPRAIIFSGHGPSPRITLGTKQRKRQILSIQTFKKWKRAHCLVAAVPYFKKATKVVLAGDGIELRYMRSKNKCKAEYMVGDQRIWDLAVQHRLHYKGTISEQARDNLLQESLFLVDLSTRQNTGQINRVVVEAIRQGCVPIAVNEFIAGNPSGNGELFKAHEHYLPIDSRLSPQQLAKQIDQYLNISTKDYQCLQKNGRNLIKMFSRKIAAEQIIELSNGKKTGWKYGTGENHKNLISKGKKLFTYLFPENGKST